MLSEAQVARIEQRLLEERRNAMRTLRETRRDIGRADAPDIGPAGVPLELAEQGSEAQKEMFSIQTAERHSELLELIDGALVRLREHPEEYDVSAVSGQRIPFERLELVPWTRVLAQETGIRVAAGARAAIGDGGRLGNGARNGHGAGRVPGSSAGSRDGWKRRRTG
jgi:RNA polymerase-binding transcription factor DksA